jgi:hypothetical protein
MVDPYASARRKWDRAEYHRNMLETDFKRLAQFGGSSAGLQFERQPHRDYFQGDHAVIHFIVLLGQDVPQISDNFPLILGDAIAGYRTALDHLTWALVKRFGAKLDAKQARGVQFPMHNSAADFRSSRNMRTPGVPDKPYRALLQRYQPYSRGDGPSNIRWLRTLADSDKHRELIPSVIAPAGVQIKAQSFAATTVLRKITPLMTKAGPVKSGTPIAEITVATPRTKGLQAAVKVDAQFTLFPLMRGRKHPGGRLLGISNTVREIIDEVAALG